MTLALLNHCALKSWYADNTNSIIRSNIAPFYRLVVNAGFASFETQTYLEIVKCIQWCGFQFFRTGSSNDSESCKRHVHSSLIMFYIILYFQTLLISLLICVFFLWLYKAVFVFWDPLDDFWRVLRVFVLTSSWFPRCMSRDEYWSIQISSAAYNYDM